MTSSPAVIPLTRPVTTPRQFGKYVLLRKLAEGGMAEIFLAKQTGAEGFERDVVIKCMLDHFTQYRDFIAMFLDEARLAARLHHPNIVQITDLGVADNRYYICMEYLAGEDLDSVIAAAHYRREPIPIPIAARIMLSVLEGLEFAHGFQEQGQLVGLVHRDISPSNIFVTYQGTVKVLDFGIAKASSRMTQTQPGLLKGKWGYMSPEQARGEQIDARSDLFSVGVTFYELLTARRVFERDNEIGVLLALMDQPIPPPSQRRADVPAALDGIVMKALERRAQDRYASAAEMRADLEEFLRVTPSAPGMTQLAQYMQGLFGPAEVERKTKIPSLTELAAIKVEPQPQPQEDPVGFAKTVVRPSDPGIPAITTERMPAPAINTGIDFVPAAVSPPALIAPVPAPPPPARSQGLSIAAGALGALLLVALGGGAAWYFLPRATPPPTVIVTTPAPAPVPVVTPAPTPAPVPTPAPAAPPEPVAQQAETPPTPLPMELATPVVTPKQPRPARELTPADVNREMQKQSSKIRDCLKKFVAELPEKRVLLQITIANSGKVSTSRVSEPSTVPTGLEQCLKGVMRGAKFPANSNKPDYSIEIPLKIAAK
jgi:serine/threonine-protein kinase